MSDFISSFYLAPNNNVNYIALGICTKTQPSPTPATEKAAYKSNHTSDTS